MSRGQRQGRELVDEGGYLGTADRGGAQFAGANPDVGHRLRAAADFVNLDVRLHPSQNRQDAGAGGVDADAAECEVGVGMDGGGDHPECRRGDVAGDVDVHRGR